jgi:hypothetical protein
MNDTEPNYELTDVELFENDSNCVGMYSFYDKKSKRYDTPFFCQSDMFAGRHYKMITGKEGTMLNTFKKDFNVVRLGFYNMKTGVYNECYDMIINGKNEVKKDQEEN